MRRALLLLCTGACIAASPAATPYSRMDLPWWRARFEAKQMELQSHPADLLWLGDSITQDWEKPEFAAAWQRFYGDRHAVNLGFKGDATAHLLWRIEHGETDGLHPKCVIVLIGANNFGHLHWAAAPTLEGIAAIVAELQARLPGKQILLLGVLPSIRSTWVDQNTAALNQALARRFGHAPGVVFRDLAPLFVKDGRVDAGAFLDGQLVPPDPPLHPSAQTQARMAAAIEPVVSRMMGDRDHRG